MLKCKMCGNKADIDIKYMLCQCGNMMYPEAAEEIVEDETEEVEDGSGD